MTVHFAIFDPSVPQSNGSYWTCGSDTISPALLDRVYYEYAHEQRPQDPSSLLGTDLLGGCAGVDETWCCWYRFVDGGRDLRGRPGRFIILAAFISRMDMVGRDCLGVLQSGTFQSLAGSAPITCPLVPPQSEND